MLSAGIGIGDGAEVALEGVWNAVAVLRLRQGARLRVFERLCLGVGEVLSDADAAATTRSAGAICSDSVKSAPPETSTVSVSARSRRSLPASAGELLKVIPGNPTVTAPPALFCSVY